MKHRRFTAATFAALVLAGGLWITGASDSDVIAQIETAVSMAPSDTVKVECPTELSFTTGVKKLKGSVLCAPSDPTPTPTPDPTPDPSCEGVSLRPSQNLAAAVADEPSGTIFCLAAGTYDTLKVLPKNGMTIVGAGIAETVIDGSGADLVFDAGDNVTLARMTIRGGTGDGTCKPGCGKGARFGFNGLVDTVRLTDNDNHGIGGASRGLVVRDSEIDHNGTPDFNGCCGGGIKIVKGFSVVNSYVHHNVGNGIWCDRECPGSTRFVENLVENNTRNGIAYEVSGGPAVIFDNIIRNNNLEDARDKGGLKITASKNVEAYGNIFRNNNGHSIRAAGEPRMDKKEGAGRGYELENIFLHDNDLGGHPITGCGNDGVTCSGNF